MPGRGAADDVDRGPHLRGPQGRPRRRPPHPPLCPVPPPPRPAPPFVFSRPSPGPSGAPPPPPRPRPATPPCFRAAPPCFRAPVPVSCRRSRAPPERALSPNSCAHFRRRRRGVLRAGRGWQAVAGGGEGDHRRGAAAQVHLRGAHWRVHGGAPRRARVAPLLPRPPQSP